jgi:cytoskeletal protein RodZ
MNFPLETLWGVGIILLLGALIWGVHQYRNRNPRNSPITETATRELYQHPENYEKTARDLKKKIHPS